MTKENDIFKDMITWQIIMYRINKNNLTMTYKEFLFFIGILENPCQDIVLKYRLDKSVHSVHINGINQDFKIDREIKYHIRKKSSR